MRLRKHLFVLMVALFGVAATSQAQTSTSAVVVGTVTDMSAAVISDAHVSLRNTQTGAVREQDTGATGAYAFPNVAPGTYTVTVSRDGFRSTTVQEFTADVTKSYTVDVALEVGSTATRVEVSAAPAVELQTTNATIGDVLAHEEMINLPTLRRDAIELLTLQPGATPLAAQGDRTGQSGGTVSGARSDQNAVALDGIDISDIFNAGNPTSETVVPMNVEATSEFRVGVANPNASVVGASGGQVSVASRAGTNALHGSVYWYIQNTALNANSWENNHTIDPLTGKIQPRAPIHDNRGGFALGGPIKKDKTFFFVNYEPRRFITTYGGNANQELNLPSADFRNGIINFTNPVTNLPDVACFQNAAQVAANVSSPHSSVCGAIAPNANGARISSNCGASGNQLCDPRQLGMSPTVSALLNLIKPLPNDPSVADAVGCTGDLSCQNLSGYLFNSRARIQDDFFNVRLDHNLTQNLHFYGRYAWLRDISYNNSQAQVDLTTAGNPLLDGVNTRGEDATVGLDWSIRSNLVNSFHFGWVRQRIDLATLNEAAIANRLKLPGAQDSSGNYDAFEVGDSQGASQSELIAQPIRPNTNGFDWGKNIQFTDDLNWIKGNHTFVFGGDVRWQPTRNAGDIGQGGVSTPRVYADALGSSQYTPGIDNGAFGGGYQIEHLYDSMLGLVYQTSYYQQLNTSTFQPVSGHPIADLETHTHSLYFYMQDSWRVKPNLTFTYGLAWGVQTPYTEDHGRGMVLVDSSTNKPVDAIQVLATKKADALTGINYNPTYGYVPYQKLGMSGMWNTDWSDWAPRASIAWSPSSDSGLFGRLFGNGKTVIRTGYALVYDRLSGGTIAHLFGQPGFNAIPSSNAPACAVNSQGQPTTGPLLCDGTNSDPAVGAFRAGIDGPLPIVPAYGITPPTATTPYVPDVGQAGAIVFSYDPNYKLGQNHMIDFSIQRELPGNMILEVGYIGRLARRLPGPYALNADPYMFTDPASGQSFAQANDCIAQTLRYGVMSNWPAMPKLGSFACQDSGGNILPQPFFENQLPTGWGAAPSGCGGGTNTACIVSQAGGSFVSGNIGGVFGVFNAMTGATCGPVGQFASTGGARTLVQFQQCSLYNTQELDLQQRTSTDFSNYHALTVTLRNRGWHGLVYDLNYTFSKSLDQGGRTQGFINGFDDPFNPNAMYGPSYFDRSHVFNTVYNYNLPFGPGRKFGGGDNHLVQRLIGGWSASGVFRAMSGLPLVVAESGFAYGGGLITSNNVDMIPIGHNYTTGLIGNSQGSYAPAGSACANYVVAMGGGAPDPTHNNDVLVGGNSSSKGYNYFSDPAAAYCSFRPILLTADTRDGRGNPLRGFGQWNLDASFAKETAIGERFKIKFSADFFNIFNHVSFDDPLAPPLSPTDFIDATNAGNFGVVSNSFTPAQRPVGSRWIQLGLRVDF